MKSSNLTQSQLAIWIGQQMHPGVPLYNEAHTFTIHGEVDPDHFARAFQAVVDRSDALRTVFTQQDGSPIACVKEHLHGAFEVLDFTTEPNPDAVLSKWLDERCIQPFDLGQRLFDSVLIRLAPERFVWYFNQHHLTADITSIRLTFEKTSEFYSLSVAGELDTAPPMAQFGDYIAYEERYINSPVYEKAEAYWNEKLAATREPTAFYGRSMANNRPETARIVCPLGETRSRKLKELAEQKGVRALTPDMTQLSIFSALLFTYLYRLTDADQLAIGTPFHNRTAPPFKQTLGLFINIFPLIVQAEESETFRSFIQKCLRETMSSMRFANHVRTDAAQTS
ncbi:hypothetical protein KFU94_33200 [Chloroflexi bacterium TSY]|nr:hypothetical protein [Chloroflexi bacterium TSY]